MAIQVLIPILGEAISEAHLVNWLKEPGQEVRRGEELAELETDKATLTVECPANGILLSVLSPAGVIVYPGQVVAIVGQPGEEAPDVPVAETKKPEPVSITNPEPIQTQPSEDEQRITPAARRLAKTAGIDIRLVNPSGLGARVTSDDVQRYLDRVIAKQPGELPSFHRQELNQVQRMLSERMVTSARDIPQFSVSIEANANRLIQYKSDLKARGQDTSLTSILIAIVSRVLMRHPLLNARFDSGSILIFETVNMAVAIQTPLGLVAPVIYSAQQLDLTEISKKLDLLILAARENRLNLDQISNATFTISNLGMYGVHQFTPLVNPPQAAILGVGGIHDAIVLTDSGLLKSPRIYLTISADHRILDGVAVSLFLNDLSEEIGNLTTL